MAGGPEPECHLNGGSVCCAPLSCGSTRLPEEIQCVHPPRSWFLATEQSADCRVREQPQRDAARGPHGDLRRVSPRGTGRPRIRTSPGLPAGRLPARDVSSTRVRHGAPAAAVPGSDVRSGSGSDRMPRACARLSAAARVHRAARSDVRAPSAARARTGSCSGAGARAHACRHGHNGDAGSARASVPERCDVRLVSLQHRGRKVRVRPARPRSTASLPTMRDGVCLPIGGF